MKVSTDNVAVVSGSTRWSLTNTAASFAILMRCTHSNVSRRHVMLFLGCLVLFSGTAILTGMPGADWNAPAIYNVTLELSQSLRYTLSRTPGQPFLDYMNFICFRFAGVPGIHAWYVVVSGLGILALYNLLCRGGGSHPLIGAATLALNPLYLAHVGGVGDFAASSSFLLMSLCAGAWRYPLLAGAFLALASGCRLVFLAYLIPLASLIALNDLSRGARLSNVIRSVSLAAFSAVSITALFYAPLFAFFGKGLLDNMRFQTIRYHATAFAYKLMTSLGIPVWLVVAVAVVIIVRRWSNNEKPTWNNVLAGVAVLTAASCTLYFFRVPTKPSLAVPILIAIIIIVQLSMKTMGSWALLSASILAGVAIASPYDRIRDVYGWHLEPGWYHEELEESNRNRFHISDVHDYLASITGPALLITQGAWTSEQAARYELRSVNHVGKVGGLTQAVAFQDLGPSRVCIDPADPQLPVILRTYASQGGQDHFAVYYEDEYLGLMRRWNGIDFSRFGRRVSFRGSPLTKALGKGVSLKVVP